MTTQILQKIGVMAFLVIDKAHLDNYRIIGLKSSSCFGPYWQWKRPSNQISDDWDTMDFGAGLRQNKVGVVKSVYGCHVGACVVGFG